MRVTLFKEKTNLVQNATVASFSTVKSKARQKINPTDNTDGIFNRVVTVFVNQRIK